MTDQIDTIYLQIFIYFGLYQYHLRFTFVLYENHLSKQFVDGFNVNQNM